MLFHLKSIDCASQTAILLDFNVRWIWMGNKAYTPVNEQKSIQYGFPWVDVDDIIAGHLPNYRNLSLRIDRRFYFSRTNLLVYVGAWNVMNQKNELYRYWDTTINAYEAEYMSEFIPFVGLEFEFQLELSIVLNCSSIVLRLM